MGKNTRQEQWIPIPKEVKIVFEGIGFIIQVWEEIPTRIFAGEGNKVADNKRDNASIQRSIHNGEATMSMLSIA